MDVIVDRCAGLDVHKKTVMATVRSPDGRRRRQETREFATFTGRLVELRDWLVAEDVTQVAMETTGVYWRPLWHVLEEAASLELLVNPAHFKNLPGRKTDVKDSEWLAQLLECGLLRGSFIPPANIAKAAGLDPLPHQDHRRAGAGDPTDPEAARRRRHQVGLRRHRRIGRVVPADAGGPDRR
jgi:transposase